MVLISGVGEVGQRAIAGSGAGAGGGSGKRGVGCIVEIPLGDQRIGGIRSFSVARVHPAFRPVDGIPGDAGRSVQDRRSVDSVRSSTRRGFYFFGSEGAAFDDAERVEVAVESVCLIPISSNVYSIG